MPQGAAHFCEVEAGIFGLGALARTVGIAKSVPSAVPCVCLQGEMCVRAVARRAEGSGRCGAAGGREFCEALVVQGNSGQALALPLWPHLGGREPKPTSLAGVCVRQRRFGAVSATGISVSDMMGFEVHRLGLKACGILQPV